MTYGGKRIKSALYLTFISNFTCYLHYLVLKCNTLCDFPSARLIDSVIEWDERLCLTLQGVEQLSKTAQILEYVYSIIQNPPLSTLSSKLNLYQSTIQ
jgi:hypothetical protein